MHPLTPNPHDPRLRIQKPKTWPLTMETASKNSRSSEQGKKTACQVLIIDRDPMSSDMLASLLDRDMQFHAVAVASSDLLPLLAKNRIDMVVLGAELSHGARNGFDLAAEVTRSHPSVMIVMLLNQPTPEAVINSFRSGARGVFSRDQPMTAFLECIGHVSKGFVWAGRKETTHLLEAFRSIPSPNLTAAHIRQLTSRELQVVRSAASGRTNKAIASELGLSEHTVKNYLFRAFEKMGVSNRVELLFGLMLSGQYSGPAPLDSQNVANGNGHHDGPQDSYKGGHRDGHNELSSETGS